ncbi:MAG: terpene cyclase/mutase family protein [Gemmataceae bacterium]|nr:terpene cyclase/mutase family protein [Gemmataceae bacterium]
MLVELACGDPLPAQAPKSGADPKEWNAAVDKAVAFLKGSQAEDGSWSKQANPGVTALVVQALLRTGKVTPDDPMIKKALKFIESMADAETGSLAGKDGKARLQNYLTSVNLTTLLQADRKQYAAIGEKAVKFLKTMPQDEGRGKERKDAIFGGVGYDGSTRPDMSNTIFCLEALRTAQVKADDPVYAKILVFVSRSQNLKSESNDQPWAGKINDGSFIYGAGPAGAKKGAEADAARPGYGSITCSGLVALDDCGVKKDDPRFKKALEWIQKEYSVDKNPGTPGDGMRGYYLWLKMLTEALTRAGVDTIVESDKKTHDWKAEVTAALISKQSKEGSWANKSPAWMESNADLATAWALMALSNCKPSDK